MRAANHLGRTAPSNLRPEGFTLIELLVVMAILASLAAILVPIINSGRRVAKIAAAKHLVGQMEAAIERFNEQWGYYPPDKIPNDTDLKYFDARGAAADTSSFGTSENSESSSQALYYALCNLYVTPHSPYLELSDKESDAATPSAATKIVIPRIIDRWDNAFQYNRKNSLSGVTLPTVFRDKSGNAYDLGSFDDGTDPTHNTGSYDLWSRGPAGYAGAQLITNWK